jgi:hypothetical protein
MIAFCRLCGAVLCCEGGDLVEMLCGAVMSLLLLRVVLWCGVRGSAGCNASAASSCKLRGCVLLVASRVAGYRGVLQCESC